MHSHKTEEKSVTPNKVCKNNKQCKVIMPNDENKVLKCNHGPKLIKLPFVVHVDFETILEKVNACDNDREASYTTEPNKYTACCFSTFVKYNYDNSMILKNKHFFMEELIV